MLGIATYYHLNINVLNNQGVTTSDNSVYIFRISGKIGYGTTSEAMAYKLPFVFVRRDYFNEEPFLRNMLEVANKCYLLTFFLIELIFHY